MCGILGLLGKNENHNPAKFKSALNTLIHRGPDNQQIWRGNDILLGHQRLSILDLSKSGHQPMLHAQSNSIITFNGEIYNYKELAQELKQLGYKFRGNSDTEVLLYSLIQWGPEVISRLNGMWAFAFWSERKKELIISRDRFGVKPLFIHQSKDTFAFASEPKAILSLYPELRSLNKEIFLSFLKNNLLFSKNKSFYKNIDCFPPGHFGVYNINNKKLKLSRYWDYPETINHSITNKEAIEEFSTLLNDSVNLRLRSDVTVGVTLSGGLDSTSILTAASKKRTEQITCFTSTYDKLSVDEFKWANKASSAVGSKLIKVISKEEEWLNTLKEIVKQMDSPGYSPAVFPLWNIMKKAREMNVLVVLDGQGADEALAGYPQYAALNIIQNFSKKNIKLLFSELKSMKATFGLSTYIANILAEIMPNLKNYYQKKASFQSILLDEFIDPPYSNRKKKLSLKEQLRNDHSSLILPGLLHYGDSISMSHGVEIRNPFLDYRLVDWIFKLPTSLLFNNHETKWVLREFLRMNNQNAIADRKDKKGFPTSINSFLISDEVTQILMSDDNPMLEWCSKKKINKLINLNKKGFRSAEFNLYKLLSSQLWIEECIKV